MQLLATVPDSGDRFRRMVLALAAEVQRLTDDLHSLVGDAGADATVALEDATWAVCRAGVAVREVHAASGRRVRIPGR